MPNRFCILKYKRERERERKVEVEVYDVRNCVQRSQRVVAFWWISHMEWQILLATGMPTVTSTKSVTCLISKFCFLTSILMLALNFLVEFWNFFFCCWRFIFLLFGMLWLWSGACECVIEWLCVCVRFSLLESYWEIWGMWGYMSEDMVSEFMYGGYFVMGVMN